jgi:hypothetical protein
MVLVRIAFAAVLVSGCREVATSVDTTPIVHPAPIVQEPPREVPASATTPFVRVTKGALQLTSSRQGDVLVGMTDAADGAFSLQRAKAGALTPAGMPAEKGPAAYAGTLGTLHRLDSSLVLERFAMDHSGMYPSTIMQVLGAAESVQNLGKPGPRLWGFFPWHGGTLAMRSAAAAGSRMTGNASAESNFVLLHGLVAARGAPTLQPRTVGLDFVVMPNDHVVVLALDVTTPVIYGDPYVLDLGADGKQKVHVAVDSPRVSAITLAADGGAWLYDAPYILNRGAGPEASGDTGFAGLAYFDGTKVTEMQSALPGTVQQIAAGPDGITWVLTTSNDAKQSYAHLARARRDGERLLVDEVMLPAGRVISHFALGAEHDVWLETTAERGADGNDMELWYARPT